MADINKDFKNNRKPELNQNAVLQGDKNTDSNEDTGQDEYCVGGYVFHSKEAYIEAKDESNAIKYMSTKTNLKDARQVYVLYNRILDKELFNTQIGINYLKQLQSYLYLAKQIPNEKIRPIPIERDLSLSLKDRRNQMQHMSEFKDMQKKNNQYRRRLNASVIFNVLLVLAIIAMVYITIYSKSANVLNYEVNLQDKYASWEEQLKAEEASVKARENELDKRENKTSEVNVTK